MACLESGRGEINPAKMGSFLFLLDQHISIS